jgi:hypothetical protein
MSRAFVKTRSAISGVDSDIINHFRAAILVGSRVQCHSCNSIKEHEYDKRKEELLERRDCIDEDFKGSLEEGENFEYSDNRSDHSQDHK